MRAVDGKVRLGWSRAELGVIGMAAVFLCISIGALISSSGVDTSVAGFIGRYQEPQASLTFCAMALVVLSAMLAWRVYEMEGIMFAKFRERGWSEESVANILRLQLVIMAGIVLAIGIFISDIAIHL
ncbi:MAG: hypothetical protein ABTQ30_14460 [Rhizobiaceae bacterium]